jgi:hypothetical protein
MGDPAAQRGIRKNDVSGPARVFAVPDDGTVVVRLLTAYGAIAQVTVHGYAIPADSIESAPPARVGVPGPWE